MAGRLGWRVPSPRDLYKQNLGSLIAPTGPNLDLSRFGLNAKCSQYLSDACTCIDLLRVVYQK